MTSPEPNNNRSPKADGNEPMLMTLTLRIIMQGKEAGSIIGKKGDNVKRFREESGARINISDASCPERIVTVTGTTQQLVSAFTMICRRFEEDLQNANPNTANSKQLITLRLIMPATQCGSLIGKGGTKIKEIRDIAGASIQISSDMLPNSTERAVTVSGSVEAVARGIHHICAVMLESPPKGATIPYRPKLVMAPVIMAGGQAFAVPGQFVVPQADPRVSQQTAMVQYQPVPQFAKMAIQQGMVGHAIPQYMAAQTFLAPSYQALGIGGIGGFVRAAAPPTMVQTAQTHEISIPNDLIGCIIGRGGSKINEIRQLSGANIKIAGAEEGSMDRTVTITGLPEAISAAQYLINTSLQLHNTLALNLDPGANTFSPASPLTALPPSSVALTPMNVGGQAVATEYHSALALTSMKTMALSPMTLTPINSHASSAMNTPVNAAPVAMPPATMPMVNLPPLLNSAMFGPMPLAPQQQSTPNAQFAIPIGSLMKPFPVLNYGSIVGTTFFDTRADLATKIKGGMALAAGRNGNKFTPY